jgi:hypothetical protein
MNHPITRRMFLERGGAALTFAAATGLPADAENKSPAIAGATWSDLPVRALLLSPPQPEKIVSFCNFVRDVLPKEGVNTLVLRFEFQYQFQRHPELADRNALSNGDVKQIVRVCKDAGIKLVPCTNLLAHQSDRDVIAPLLKAYPQFDESPDFNPPHPWVDGGEFGFYTKSLCPRHPDLHKIIFSLMDELIDICEADAFHVGLDEVWIIAHPKCPRCGGRDPAEVFAQHATALRNHLAEKNCRMWMWSDRLIDGKTSNLLAWQASMNNTWRAIDMIPRDILICDWKYEDAPPTPALFAIKGFDVVASPCYKADVALAQLEMVYLIRKNAARADFSKTISSRMLGMFHTSWVGAEQFIRAYYGQENKGDEKNVTDTFKTLFAEIRRNSPK